MPGVSRHGVHWVRKRRTVPIVWKLSKARATPLARTGRRFAGSFRSSQLEEDIVERSLFKQKSPSF
jgi:hypothetical protein